MLIDLFSSSNNFLKTINNFIFPHGNIESVERRATKKQLPRPFLCDVKLLQLAIRKKIFQYLLRYMTGIRAAC